MMAAQSWGVSFMELPEPWLMPALMAEPGMITMVFAPMLSKDLAMAEEEPLPISIIAITAPTPMTMPKVVRSERRGFLRKARKAETRVRRTFIPACPSGSWR
jgi:hypothetical protein